MRVPERWMPGRFDLVFSSHQIFHVAVVTGALVHLAAIMVLLEWRDASGGCALPRGLSGPLGDALQEFKEQGRELLSIEQVWDMLRAQLHLSAGAAHAGGAPAAAPAPVGA
jgi:adiponectin receptor